MAKKPNDKDKKKGGKRLGKPGSKARKTDDKARNSKRTEKVYLPAVIVKPKEDEPLCEEEISYKDRLLAVEMEKLASKGLNNDQIIKELGISRDTFYRKLKNESYFSYALFKHRHIADQNVENALYKRAVGYTVLEKTIEAKPFQEFDINGNVNKGYKLIDSKITEIDVPGDVKAQEFYLTNRVSEQWKKKVEPKKESIADMSRIVFTLKKRSEL